MSEISLSSHLCQTVEFMALEILTSDDAKPLKPSQRKCRLEHEAQPLSASPIYSYNLCRSQCRFRIAMKGTG